MSVHEIAAAQELHSTVATKEMEIRTLAHALAEANASKDVLGLALTRLMQDTGMVKAGSPPPTPLPLRVEGSASNADSAAATPGVVWSPPNSAEFLLSDTTSWAGRLSPMERSQLVQESLATASSILASDSCKHMRASPCAEATRLSECSRFADAATRVAELAEGTCGLVDDDFTPASFMPDTMRRGGSKRAAGAMSEEDSSTGPSIHDAQCSHGQSTDLSDRTKQVRAVCLF